jgi:hyperosmotically inducible protein
MSTSKFSPWILALTLGVVAATPVVQGCRTNQSVGSQMSDASITAAVKTKMIGDNEVKARNIEVNTEHGVVYLMGRVATQHEKDEAERLARKCDGVRDVVNQLEVSSA